MNFFQQLSFLLEDEVTINLTVRKDKDGQMVVSLLPSITGVKDDAVKSLPNIVLRGKPEEIDEAFFMEIDAPMVSVGRLSSNVRSFEQKLEQKEAATAVKKAEEDAAKKKADSDKKKEEAKKAKEEAAGTIPLFQDQK